MKREAKAITDPEQVQQILENMDNKTMKRFQERIDLALKFIKDIKDKIYSGEKMSIKELRKLKLSAFEHKGILEEIDTNPEYKIFLHLSTNEKLQNIYTKRLHETIINAINGLETSVNIIDSRIEVSTDLTEADNNKVDFTKLLLKVKKDKDNVTRNEVENILSQINETRVNLYEAKGKEFTAVASILYRTGWITKNTTFADWLRTFSAAYNRSMPTYKETQVKDCIEAVKRKAPFLDKLPFVDKPPTK